MQKQMMWISPLTWSPVGRYCWGPSCLVAGPTRGWLAHRLCPEQGREWGCVPLSGCFCSGCWQTGGIQCGGCVEGAVEAVAWTDCGGWQPLEEDKNREQLKNRTFCCEGNWVSSESFHSKMLQIQKRTEFDLIFCAHFSAKKAKLVLSFYHV